MKRENINKQRGKKKLSRERNTECDMEVISIFIMPFQYRRVNSKVTLSREEREAREGGGGWRGEGGMLEWRKRDWRRQGEGRNVMMLMEIVVIEVVITVLVTVFCISNSIINRILVTLNKAE